jgi:hypothetical protein
MPRPRTVPGCVPSIWKTLQSVVGWASLREPRRLRATRRMVLQSVGLDGSSDAVPALCTLMPALTSRNGVSERACALANSTQLDVAFPCAHRPPREREKRLRLRPHEAANASETFDSVPRGVCWRRNTKSLHFVKQSRAPQAKSCSCPSRTSELPIGALASSDDLAAHLVFEGRV